MSLLGKIIHLKGISQKGKNRIRENSTRWVVLAETETVLFNPGMKGPWLFISPANEDQNHRASRWIHLDNDPDFVIVKDD